MPVPFRYNVRSIFYRKTTTLLTLLAIALTVGVVTIVLAVRQGFVGAAARAGRPDNVICMRQGSTSEGESSVTLDVAQTVVALPEVARSAEGLPLAVPEIYLGFYLLRENGKGGTNVSIRGTSPLALQIRPDVTIGEGRMFTPGRREIVVGKGLVGRIRGCRPGGALTIRGEDWAVVGVIDAKGSAYESEVWADADQLRQFLNRPGWNTVIFRAAPGIDVGEAARVVVPDGLTGVELANATKLVPATGLLGRLEGSDYKFKAVNEQVYFEQQAGLMGMIIGALAGLLAVLLSFGAIFGCTNTLLAAVSGRTREIGSLLALGFRPRDILIGFLTEALLIGLLGGVAGILLASPMHGSSTGTFGFGTFTESTFRFEITPPVIAIALGLAAFVGLVGGVMPAIRASRLAPVNALRD